MKYNFGDVSNIEDFLNEVGLEVELTELENNTIVSVTSEGDVTEYEDLNDLNDFANEYLADLIENKIPLEEIDDLIEEFAEPSVPVLIKIPDINNKSIIKNVEYQIYTYVDDHCIKTPFGDNRLIVREHGISFTIQDGVVFKYYRGVLSLEEHVKFYVDFAKEFFRNKEGIEVDAYCSEEDISMDYRIKLYSNDNDVSKFISLVLDFQSEFEDKLSNIENQILQLLGR